MGHSKLLGVAMEWSMMSTWCGAVVVGYQHSGHSVWVCYVWVIVEDYPALVSFLFEEFSGGQWANRETT